MADWPTVAQVKRRLGINSEEAGVAEDVTSALNAAVEQVKIDTGADWDEGGSEDPPEVTASLSEAALLLTVACYKATDAPHGVAAVFDTGGIYVARQNPHYWRLLTGQRERFGVA